MADIRETPDVAVWFKATSSRDNLENIRETLTQNGSTKRKEQNVAVNAPMNIDPANSKNMSKVIKSGSSITDKPTFLSDITNKTKLNRIRSGTSGKSKIVKFHGTKVYNVIIHHTKGSYNKPRAVPLEEFDALKTKGQFETINIQVIADYVAITFYKEEASNTISQRELIPAHRVEHIWIKE